jgi:hypothetical protein
MKLDKARGSRPTRTLLAVAIIATAIVMAFALWSAFWAPPTLGGTNPSVLGLPSTVVDCLTATGVACPIGLGVTTAASPISFVG